MTNPLPDDIVQEARRVWRDMGFVNDRHNQVPILAQALLAERRKTAARCAEICDAEGNEWDSDLLQTYKNYPHACRERIFRAFLEPSQEQEG